MKRFEEIPHTADWSFRAFGKDLPELYENAAFAMFAMEGTVPPDAESRQPEIKHSIDITGLDYETLLVNWLNELLYRQDLDHETYYQFRIESLASNRLHALVGGMLNRKIDKLIKAATFHDLRIEQTNDGWQAVVVVDV